MKCPECGKELVLGGAFKVEVGYKTIEPSPDYKTYTCINESCSKYNKPLVYDVKQQKWKS